MISDVRLIRGVLKVLRKAPNVTELWSESEDTVAFRLDDDRSGYAFITDTPQKKGVVYSLAGKPAQFDRDGRVVPWL